MTVLVSDSFNRANSSTSLGTTDSYNGGSAKTWSVYAGGTFGISSNQAYAIASTNNLGYATVDAGVSDGKLTITLPVVANGLRIIFRAVNNTYLTLAATGGTYQLYSQTNTSGTSGTWTQIKDSGIAPANNDTVVITYQGTSITVTLNGTQIISTTSTVNQTATQAGIGATNSNSNMSTFRWDNFQVESLSSSTTYSGSGSITGTSSLTSGDKSIKKESGSIQGSANLTSNDHLNLGVSGGVQGYSTLGVNEGLFLSDGGNIMGSSNLFSSETFIIHSGTTYSGSGNIVCISNLSSNEIINYVSFGDILGQSSMDSKEILIGMREPQVFSESGKITGFSGLMSHEKMIHFVIPVYPVAEIHLKGMRKANVYLLGEQIKNLSLLGRQDNTIYLKGVKK